ncbi:MAG: phage tail tape measure protein, partial [bacterium]|nr:phage tail tape measure protein [bacterium]
MNGMESAFQNELKNYQDALSKIIYAVNKKIEVDKLVDESPENLIKKYENLKKEMLNLNLQKLDFKGSKQELDNIDDSIDKTREKIDQLTEAMLLKRMEVPTLSDAMEQIQKETAHSDNTPDTTSDADSKSKRKYSEKYTDDDELSGDPKKAFDRQTHIENALSNIDKEFSDSIVEITRFYDSQDQLVKAKIKRAQDINGERNITTTALQYSSEAEKVYRNDIVQTQRNFKNEEKRNKEFDKYFKEYTDNINQNRTEYTNAFGSLLDERDADLLSRARDTYKSILSIEEAIVKLEGESNADAQILKKQSDLDNLKCTYDSILEDMQKISDESGVSVYQNWMSESSSMKNESDSRIETIRAKQADKRQNKAEKDVANKSDVEIQKNKLTSFVKTLEEFSVLSGDAKEKSAELSKALKEVGTNSELGNLKKEIQAFVSDPDLNNLIRSSKDIEKDIKTASKSRQDYINQTEGKLLSFETRIDNNEVSNAEEYKQRISDIRELLRQINEMPLGHLTSPDDAQQLVFIKGQIQELMKELNSGKQFKLMDEGNIITQQKYIGRINKWLRENTAAGDGLKEKFKALIEEFEKVSDPSMLKPLIKNYFKLEAIAEDTGQVGLSFFDRWKKSMKSLSIYLASYVSFENIVDYLRQGLEIIKDYNSTLKEMRKVTSDSVKTLKAYQKESFGLANDVGTTAQQLQISTADWLRLGEDLDDAKKSAQESNVLFNISEFETIDEATKGLTALSQAYKDLDKRDIVDKLVGVGDNFPIAVDELTEGMQNVAAVLQTQGVSIEQAMALVTAANATMQDVSKSSMGVRTIALRLAGTEAAKDELVQLGEDVSDYVIQTKSKKQQIVKDYTAVKSNDYKGIDILDSNGNQRNPYEILRDISKIYREIQNEDKKAGTNRAIGLIEEIAGKQRSTAAAGILLNGDILEKAYEQGLNSEGIAQKELNAQLDSIEGKLTRIKNTADEFWTNLINDGVVTNVIDFGNSLLSIVNSFTKLVGLLPGVNGGITTLAGVAGGALLSKFGVGPFKYDKENDKIISQRLRYIKEFFKKDDFNVSDEISNILTELNSIGIENWSSKSGEISEKLKDNLDETDSNMVTKFMDYVKEHGDDVDVNIDAYKEWATNIELIGNKAAKAKAIIKSLGASLLNGLTSAAITVGIQLIVVGIDNIVHASEKGKEALDEFYTSVEKNREGLKSQSDFLSSDDIKEWEQLSKGVDAYGNSIYNTAEEMEKYHNVTNQIAEMFPNIVSHWNEQGDAVLKYGTNVESLNKALEENRKQHYYDVYAKGEDTYKAYQKDIGGWTKLGGDIESVRAYKGFIDNGFKGSMSTGVILDLLHDAHIKYSIDENDNIFITDPKQQEEVVAAYKSLVNNLNAETAKVKPLLTAYLEVGNLDYNKLNETAQAQITNIVNSFDYQFFSQYNIQEMYDWISRNLVEPFKNNPDLSISLDNIIKLNTDGMSVSMYKQQIDNFLEKLKESGFSDETIIYIKTALNLDENSNEPLINKIQNFL